MTKRISELLAYVAHNWGMECPETIQVFDMAERGASAESIWHHIQATEETLKRGRRKKIRIRR